MGGTAGVAGTASPRGTVTAEFGGIPVPDGTAEFEGILVSYGTAEPNGTPELNGITELGGTPKSSDGIAGGGYVTVCTVEGGTAFVPSNCDANTLGVEMVARVSGVATVIGGVATGAHQSE